MTEFWVSQKNKWCEYCKCWLKDTAQSWAVHERGSGHQENVTRRLRDMRLKADQEKRDEAELVVTLGKVEAEAQKRYEQDQKAAAAARRDTLGEWVWNEAAGYYYNAKHRWYYDKGTAMYYGGEPVHWTDKPTLPREARYEVMHAPPPKPPPVAAGGGGSSGAPAAATAQRQYAVAGSRISNKHPLSQVGGYQLHHVDGAVGGAKGVGHAVGGGGGAAAAAADPKRKRDDSGTGGGGKGKEKELSKEDLEFLQRREAARQRVQQRTAATFGLS
ncbi:nucleic acid binding [Micractinium conductrix]|uniref:Nucleic acid binding n=1 Tax=Micractinium conductrix TaxID=554055 RepID=A0A2P6VQA1_9CHLO|nr:nucleic acid binding [Micractinium conductrix]|eukprot:PSC76250.1 nucleic acid binding [Micractinium conductrix]